MTLEEIEQINKTTKGGDIAAAARAFLGLPDNADNTAAAVNGIVDEVTQWNEANEETRAGIEAYKAAKEHVEPSRPTTKKTTGKTTAKSK